MNSTSLPTQFLVGATRLLSVWFGLRSIDSFGASMASYVMMHSMSKEVAESFPSPWTIYLTSFVVNLIMTVVVWLAAPGICRAALGKSPATTVETAPSIHWSEAMIFLFGTLFVGWGLVRLADSFEPMIAAREQRVPHAFTLAQSTQLLVTALLTGFGVIMMSRFASISRWLDQKSCASKNVA